MKNRKTWNRNRKPRVLIVDDVSINLQVLDNILKKQGYDVIQANSGEQALQICIDVLPDLVLLDIIMPEMDGFEACKRLKEIPETKDIPIIFVSAKTETEDVVNGLHLGAVDYVCKPFNAAELNARVSTHIELKLAREIQKDLIAKLEKALADVKQLSGLLPICANCKKIRDDEGYWSTLEDYIRKHSDAEFSHGICAECAKKLYPDYFDSLK
jgi:PleD family two-component response regulator